MRIAVLALQGAFAEHRQKLAQLGVDSFEVRQLKDWDQPRMAWLFRAVRVPPRRNSWMNWDWWSQWRRRLLPACLFMVLVPAWFFLPRRLRASLASALLRWTSRLWEMLRSQLGSFYIEAPMKGIEGNYPNGLSSVLLILKRCGEMPRSLAEVDGKIVAARQGNQLVTAFHPELNESLEIHKYFLGMCSK